MGDVMDALTVTPPCVVDLSVLPKERAPCAKCGKKHHIYCGADLCLTLPPSHAAALPTVRLPLRLHVLRGKEDPNKATGAHAMLLAPHDTEIYYLPELPEYKDPSRVLLLYPSPASTPVSELDVADYDTLLVVDCTWNKVGSVMQNPVFGAFKHMWVKKECCRPAD